MTPYSSTSGDGFKIQTSGEEMDYTVEFLEENHEK